MYRGISLWLVLILLATTSADNSKVAWGDWLIVDEAEPGTGTSLLLRRITPKSVFVVPTFNGCSEGYKQDSLGRCIKLVKVNQQAQWNFFLERLNSMYAPSSTSKHPQKEAGPFHVSLPIGNQNSQEDLVINKRVPPRIVERTTTKSPLVQSTSRPLTTLPPLTTTVPTTQESTTTEVTLPTVVETSEATSTERDFISTIDSTTQTRIFTQSQFDPDVMLGDQPINTEDFTEAESLETPKNRKDNPNPTQLPIKPFVIIVTNEPPARTEETTVPTSSFTSQTNEEFFGEISSTMEVMTEVTTETTSSFTTEATLRTTKYDESFSETKDIFESSLRPTVVYRLPTTVRPKCTPAISKSRDDLIDSSDCEPTETEIVSDESREVTNPSTLPTSLSSLEPNSHVRFPSESFVPVRKTQSFVRFPDVPRPHEDRPRIWWPSWQVQQHPGVQGWPSSEVPSPDHIKSDDRVNQKHYSSFSQTGSPWADSTAWRRRFFQRD